jgi:hypothetical protein
MAEGRSSDPEAEQMPEANLGESAEGGNPRHTQPGGKLDMIEDDDLLPRSTSWSRRAYVSPRRG